MKLDVTQPILDVAGKPLKDVIDGAETELTLRSVLKACLLSEIKGDDALDPVKKAEMFWLAERIHNQDEPDVKIEDLKILKERVGKACTVTVVARVFDILEKAPRRGQKPTPASK